MILYSGIACPFSHRCRIVLYEKGMDFEIRDVDIFNKPAELADLNPYNQVPILEDRELVLYESNIINEYLDERFPHPQMMPGDPVERARGRLLLFHMERDLFCHVQTMENSNASKKALDEARQIIIARLTVLSDVFEKRKFVLGKEYSMVDVALAPLLWRLDHYDIKLGRSAAPILKYGERLFQREAFIEALTPSEKAMRR